MADFSNPDNWHAEGASSGDPIGYNCGQAFDPTSNTIYPAAYGIAQLNSYGELAKMQISY